MHLILKFAKRDAIGKALKTIESFAFYPMAIRLSNWLHIKIHAISLWISWGKNYTQNWSQIYRWKTLTIK